MIKTTTKSQERALQKTPWGTLKNNNNLDNLYLTIYNLGFDQEVN